MAGSSARRAVKDSASTTCSMASSPPRVANGPLKSKTFGGLFGVVGDGGTVRNLAVYGLGGIVFYYYDLVHGIG